MNATRTLALLAACLAAVPALASSAEKVKASVSAGKAEGGKQAVTITLDIDKEFHLYANPVGNKDLEENQVTVTFTSGKAKAGAEVKYPAGELKKDKVVGDYRIYKGKVVITAMVERAKGSPLEAAIAVQACDKSKCLAPDTI
ncbi:MAG: protein-disulfide reductase DsbD N-terminal domain-containing protein, partial [Gemmataceae bacterium]|nr:protein-disulfide reductase DsbD N-terminal domain-containing protein [Gemmataceae bacterium]